jgi:hypothetical protein
MVLPYVGFAVVLAYALQLAVDKVSTGASQYALMFVNSFTVFINVFIAFLLCIFMLYNTADFGNKKILARGNVALGVEDFADRPVVVINSLRPFWMSFIAHELAYRGEDLPASVRVLSSAFFPINVQRLGTNSLLLSSAPAFQLDPAPLMDLSTQAHGHYAYLTQTLLGLVRSANEPWQQGQVFSFPEMRITVMRLHQQKPAEIKIDLLQSIENYRFSYWDMQDESYKTFVLPAKGESRQLDGIFNL